MVKFSVYLNRRVFVMFFRHLGKAELRDSGLSWVTLSIFVIAGNLNALITNTFTTTLISVYVMMYSENVNKVQGLYNQRKQ